MQEYMINTPNLTVRRVTGAEGPKHDPYHYEEIVAKTPRGTTTYHEGFVCWLEHKDNEGLKGRMEEPDHKANDMRTTFAHYAGLTIEQIERIYNRSRSRCRKCGGRQFVSQRGYPGEHIECCSNCGHVVGSYFCKSEVE